MRTPEATLADQGHYSEREHMRFGLFKGFGWKWKKRDMSVILHKGGGGKKC